MEPHEAADTQLSHPIERAVSYGSARPHRFIGLEAATAIQYMGYLRLESLQGAKTQIFLCFFPFQKKKGKTSPNTCINMKTFSFTHTKGDVKGSEGGKIYFKKMSRRVD